MDNEKLVKGFHDLYKLVDEITDGYEMLADAELNEDAEARDKAISLMSVHAMMAISVLVLLKDTYKAVCTALELEGDADGQLDR